MFNIIINTGIFLLENKVSCPKAYAIKKPLVTIHKSFCFLWVLVT